MNHNTDDPCPQIPTKSKNADQLESLRTNLHHLASAGDVEAIQSLFLANPNLDVNTRSHYGKNTPLHSALSHNQQGFIIDYLIANGALISSFNSKGFNPIATAIINCQPGTQALEKLINAGSPWTNRFGKGKFIGLTPLDIAIEHKNKEAVKLLKRLTLDQQLHHKLQETKNTDEERREDNTFITRKPFNGTNHGVCPLCNCTVKFPTKMFFIEREQEAAEKKELKQQQQRQQQLCLPVTLPVTQPTKVKGKTAKISYTSRRYLDQFLSHSNGEAFQKLCRIEYHGVGNKNKLRKEITESYSILHAVEDCCNTLKHMKRPSFETRGNRTVKAKGVIAEQKVETIMREITRQHLRLEDVFLIDLCSGKSLTTALCSALFSPSDNVNNDGSNDHFLAIDRLPVQLVPHFIQDDDTSYLCRDIMKEDFLEELRQQVQNQTSERGRTAILVGMHLCGDLSERAIEIFHRIPLIEGLILSPCCLPKKIKHKKDLDARMVGLDSEDYYMAWSDYLKDKIDLDDGINNSPVIGKHNFIEDEKEESTSQSSSYLIESYRDSEIHSIKNSVIVAVRT